MVKIYTVVNGVLTFTNSVRTITPERDYTKDEKRELWAMFSDDEKSDIADICKAFGGKLG